MVSLLDSRSADAKEWLALVLAGQDRYGEAITLAREICLSNACSVSSRAVLVGVLSEAGRLDEALNEAKAVTEARSHVALGGVYLKMKNGAAALAAFERMAECLAPEAQRLPTSPWVTYMAGRGAALSLVGRHGEAMATFEQLLCTDREFFERWPEAAPHYQQSSRATGRNTK